MVYALASSLRTLAVSVFLLLFVIFLFAVGLTQCTADTERREEVEDLKLRYGSLRSTIYTLFLSVSNGISWDSAYMPLHNVSWPLAQALVIYVCIVNFGVLNVITSIFVESVIRSVQHFKDIIVSDTEIEREIAMGHMKEVFHQLDHDGSGTVTDLELEHFFTDPNLRKYMEALEINTEDARLLFRLLDRDGSRSISVDEFCEGCLRLKGNAKSIDVQTLMFQMKGFLGKWAEYTKFVEDSLSFVEDSLSKLGRRITESSERTGKRRTLTTIGATTEDE